MVRTVDPITDWYFDDGAAHVLSRPESNLALAVPAGITDYSGLNKFGRATDADSGVLTDIWDGANSTTAQPIWLPPTAARVHAIVSTDAGDDGNPAGVGANTLQVYGLQTWGSQETSEIVTLEGLTPKNTVNSYVIIHRMKVLSWGASGPNLGVITATAAADGTITAQINALEGQTQMAVYGVPSGVSLFMTQYYASINKAVKTAGADFRLVINTIPDQVTTGYIVKHTLGAVSEGSGSVDHGFDPYYKITGPAIVKLQVTTDTSNSAADGGFDSYLKTDDS